MEGIHVVLEEAVQSSMFKGVLVVYAYDMLFIGEWGNDNIKLLIILLHIFYYSSGHQINLQKSRLCRIGVVDTGIPELTSLIRCVAHTTLYVYLCLPVGEKIRCGGGGEEIELDRDLVLTGKEEHGNSVGIQEYVRLVNSCCGLDGGFIVEGLRNSKRGVWLSIIKAGMDFTTRKTSFLTHI
ncbi:hypothetical protein LXL04_038653 [Taraxacum kok-saghyz]